MNDTHIKHISAREILDSRGNPTVQAFVVLEDGSQGMFMTPSGASTGSREALELRDGDPKRFAGLGVLRAVAFVNTEIAALLSGKDAADQREIDQLMISADGTENKSRLGANAILAVSCACARAVAASRNIQLYQYLQTMTGGRNHDKQQFPMPLVNVINGGKHADNALDFQEFQIIPVGATDAHTAVRWSAEVFHVLGTLLKEHNLHGGVGDEGGYAAAFTSTTQALDLLVQAIEKAGFRPGIDLSLGIDAAATSFFMKDAYQYEQEPFSSAEMISVYNDLTKQYPLISIEDPLAEDDWAAWTQMTAQLGDTHNIIGDDLFVTNVRYIQKGIDEKAANAVLIKLNQIGTLSETLAAIALSHKHGLDTIVSHRSGETEDSFIADLAVASNAECIKTGSMSRSERVAKYNRLLEIEDHIRTHGI